MAIVFSTRKPLHRQTGRRALALGAVGLALTLTASAAGLLAWLRMPPPAVPCTLPILAVPRPGDVLAWSPDGDRLAVANRAGEVSTVSAADGAVTPAPRFRHTPWALAWDSGGRPLLLFRARYPRFALARFGGKGGWARLPVTGSEPAVSPNGRWLAVLTSPDNPAIWSPRRARQSHGGQGLVVWDLGLNREAARLPLPDTWTCSLDWSTPALRVVVWEGTGRAIYQYQPGKDGLRRLPPASPPAPRTLTAVYQPRPLPETGLRPWMRRLGLLSIPDWDATDWEIKIQDVQGRVIRREPLGRRENGLRRYPWYHGWKAASVSPDGRYVAVRAADDTLRLLDLRP